MQVIAVLDLLAGRAVHARAGKRENYQPVRTVAGVPIEPGDGVALARAYVDDFGVTCMYVADLDAILNQLRNLRARLNTQTAIVRELVALGVPVWLDAGVASADDLQAVLEPEVARVVVGLETLPSFEALEKICVAAGSERVVFSLDLRHGMPVASLQLEGSSLKLGGTAFEVAARAASAGVDAMIVLDLARVGTGAGPDLELIANVRKAAPRVTLVAGGGIRGPEDLSRLADIGCDGALVATAILDGHLSAEDVASAQGICNPTR
jgi:phosphoribosylformimino-5-aminoimidazole carboxamide ribotide isomerase